MQEVRVRGRARQEEVCGDTKQEREKTFEDEDPCPTRSVADSIHVDYAEGQKTRKCARYRGGGEERGNPEQTRHSTEQEETNGYGFFYLQFSFCLG